jgi:hypothetical protein
MLQAFCFDVYHLNQLPAFVSGSPKRSTSFPLLGRVLNNLEAALNDAIIFGPHRPHVSSPPGSVHARNHTGGVLGEFAFHHPPKIIFTFTHGSPLLNDKACVFLLTADHDTL